MLQPMEKLIIAVVAQGSDMWFVISEALDRYGLDNRIASCPPIRPERFEDIAVKNSEEEIKLFFNPLIHGGGQRDRAKPVWSL